jgi:hypothetical protein
MDRDPLESDGNHVDRLLSDHLKHFWLHRRDHRDRHDLHFVLQYDLRDGHLMGVRDDLRDGYSMGVSLKGALKMGDHFLMGGLLLDGPL